MHDFRISLINSALRKVLKRLHYPLEVMLTCVSAVPLIEPRVSRTLGLISRRGRPLPAAAQLLYDMLVAKRTVSNRKGTQRSTRTPRQQRQHVNDHAD